MVVKYYRGKEKMTDTASIESFIWGIADYARDAIERKDYNKIVLPFSLLRRLEQFITAAVFFTLRSRACS